MKIKHVKQVLNKKIKHWLEHINNEDAKRAISENAIVSGGSIVSLLMGEKVNDYDIYFRTTEAAKAAASYYVAEFKKNPPAKFKGPADMSIGCVEAEDRVKIVVRSSGLAGEETEGTYQYFETLPSEDGDGAFAYVNEIFDSLKDEKESDGEEEKPKYRPIFLTSNAITLSNDVQLVIRFTGEHDKIHKNYDFTHCKCAYDYANKEIYIHSDAMEYILNKHLHYSTSKYPLCSIIRTRKFLKKGWHINAGQYVKMAWDLNKLDLTDLAVLEDQMVGVDAAYFQEVINLLKERQKEGKEVDDAYLMEVIDRVF